MQNHLDYQELLALVKHQLRNLFMYQGADDDLLERALEAALERTLHCFTYCRNPYYYRDCGAFFNPFHSGQYSIFCYFLSNSIWKIEPHSRKLADKVYYLNKTLNAIDLYYEVEMPDIFFMDHPVGTVLGRGAYSDFFHCTQGCTVGNNRGLYPVFGKNVRLCSGSKVIGNCKIGRNVILGANACVKDENIPSNTVVFGSSPHLVLKTRKPSYFLNDKVWASESIGQ